MERHAPFFRKNPYNKGLVIFIHGFMGSSKQFNGLVDAAYKQGYSIDTLLLPGHGGSVKKFSEGTYERWQQYVDSEVERFSQDYDRIILVGHSMGGLLAVNTSVKFPEKLSCLFIIACPFILTKFSFYSLKVWVMQAFRRKSNPKKAAYINGTSVELTPDLIIGTIKPYFEFNKLQHAARSSLPDVTVPITAVYSSGDELTSMKSLNVLKADLKKAPLNTVILSDSLHAYYTDKEQVFIEEQFIKELT